MKFQSASVKRNQQPGRGKFDIADEVLLPQTGQASVVPCGRGKLGESELRRLGNVQSGGRRKLAGSELGSALPGLDPAYGVVGKVGGGGEVQFAANACAVDVNGFGTEAELAGDLLGGAAAADEVEDFELAVAQVLEAAFTVGADLAGVGEDADEFLGELGADVNAAFGDGADGLDEGVGAVAFHEVAAGAGAEAALGIDVLLMHGEDEHGEAGVEGDKGAEELEAAFVGKGEVGDDEVRHFALDAGERGGAGVGLGDLLDIGELLEGGANAVADEGMVVNQEDAQGPGDDGGGL